MKVRLNTEHCISSIQKVSSVTPSKSGSAMVRAIWIKAQQSSQTICFQATDGSIQFSGEYPAEVEEDGFIGVSAKSFTELLRSLPTGVISLDDSKGSKLVITQGKRQYKLTTSTTEWFQNFEDFPTEQSMTPWAGDIFAEVIEKVLFCVSEDEETGLGCLYIEPKENGEIHFCGLDGNKFAMCTMLNDDLNSKLPEAGILIQKKYLADIRKLISPNEIELSFSPKRLFIRSKNSEATDTYDKISIPLVQYSYPNYNIFFERVNTPTCSIIKTNRKEMCNALSRNLIFNTKEENCVFINFDSDSIILNSSDKNTGSATENVAATIEGDIKNVAFITKGLLEILQHIDSDNIMVKIASEEGPCSFQSEEKKDYVIVAMPMRMSNDTYYEEEEEPSND